MSGKSASRRAPIRSMEPEAAADGVLARVVDRAFENPAMSGGLVVMAITAMAIMSNAMFLQPGHHPEPLFATRPATFVTPPARAVPAVPLPRSRVEPPATAPAMPAVKVEPAPVAPAPAKAADPAAVLITAVQRELARLGIYTGAIDGISGPRTRAAISTWQSAAGLAATGEASAELLAVLRAPAAGAAPRDAALPPAVVGAASTDQVAAAVERAAELEREQAAIAESGRLRRVQVALNQIGYGPLTVDGTLSEATAGSLRRFQLDNGLPVTGELDGRVEERLIAIGALKAE